VKVDSPLSRLMRRTRDRSASRDWESIGWVLLVPLVVSSAAGANESDLAPSGGRKKGAVSEALGASFGLFRCYEGRLGLFS